MAVYLEHKIIKKTSTLKPQIDNNLQQLQFLKQAKLFEILQISWRKGFVKVFSSIHDAILPMLKGGILHIWLHRLFSFNLQNKHLEMTRDWTLIYCYPQSIKCVVSLRLNYFRTMSQPPQSIMKEKKEYQSELN